MARRIGIRRGCKSVVIFIQSKARRLSYRWRLNLAMCGKNGCTTKISQRWNVPKKLVQQTKASESPTMEELSDRILSATLRVVQRAQSSLNAARAAGQPQKMGKRDRLSCPIDHPYMTSAISFRFFTPSLSPLPFMSAESIRLVRNFEVLL